MFKFGIEYETCLLVSLTEYPDFKHEDYPQFPSIFHRRAIATHLSANGGPHAVAEGDAVPEQQPQQPQQIWQVATDISAILSFNLDFYRRLFTGSPLKDLSDPPQGTAFITSLEIISPPIDYQPQTTQQRITQFADKLNKSPFMSYHNDNTSTHIHYSFPGIDLSKDPLKLFSICMTWWYFEPILLKLVPYWRRTDNTYCTSFRVSLLEKYEESAVPNAEHMLKNLFANELPFVYDCIMFSDMKKYEEFLNNRAASIPQQIKDMIAFFQFGGEESDYFPSKYKSLNMLNLVVGNGDHPPIKTLEVRLKHGSDDGEEITKYVELYGKILHKALNVRATNCFFSRQAPGNVSYRKILIEETLDPTIHFSILCEFLGPENADLLRYFHRRLPALATDELTNTNSNSNTNSVNSGNTMGSSQHPVFLPLPQQQQAAGKPRQRTNQANQSPNKKKYTKTDEKIFYDKRYRTVYVGTRGAKYVKKHNEYKPLKHVSSYSAA